MRDGDGAGVTAFGPRTFLVGMAIQGLLSADPAMPDAEVIDRAVTLADAVLEKMQWPDGKPGDGVTSE